MDYRTWHRRIGRTIVACLCALGCVAGAPGALAESSEPITAQAESHKRLSGNTRYDTMAEIVDEASSGTSYYAVLATGQNYPDALSASGLAGALQCPIILTDGNTLSPQARTEIERHQIKHVYVMGGTSVISQGIIDELAAMGLEGSKCAGTDRTETSVLSCLALLEVCDQYPDTVILASGTSFADSLAIGPYAYSSQTPVILVGADGKLTPSEVSFFSDTYDAGIIHNVVIVGGTSAVSDDVKAQLGDKYTYVRLSGADRYETSAKIAEWESSKGLAFSNPCIATGKNFPDALAGAWFAGFKGSVLLLADSTSAPTLDLLGSHASEVKQLYVLGGSAAVSDSVATAADNAVKNPTAKTPTTEPSSANGPLTLTSANFDSAVLQSSKPVLVDFWASWCGPCRTYSPIVEEVGREQSSKLVLYKCNTDEQSALAIQFGITSIPTTILFKDGQPVYRKVGSMSKSALLSDLEQYL